MSEPALNGYWHELAPRTRRIVRASFTWVITGLIAAVFGLLTASFTGSLGPHVAEYSTTLNHEITFDMGPLGSLIVDSPLPLQLGVDVRVEQIPEELTLPGGDTITAGPDQAVAALTADLASYTQFFASPNEAISTATRGLILDGAARAVLTWALLLTVVLLGRLAAHGVLRAAAASSWRQPGVPPIVITLLLIGVTVPVVPATQGSAGAGSVSQVLAGTPLEDARITGRLGALVDHYGKAVVEEITKNDEFYDAVAANLSSALDSDSAVTEPAGPTLAMPTVTPDGSDTPGGGAREEPSGDPDSGEGEEPGPEGEAGPEALPGAPEDVGELTTKSPEEPAMSREPIDPVTMVIVADLHCNIGMGRISGLIAERVEADMILNLGDNVIGGTSVEGFCVDSFADSFGDLPVVVANGNHDSDETADQERKRGWHVLGGEPIDVLGVRFLGDDDPTLTSLGAPTRLVADENLVERGHRLSERACAEEDAGHGIDILMMHNHRTTEEALDSGCVSYAFAGHFHRRIGPWQRGLGVQYIHTSSAGAILNKPTIGPLNGPAGVTIMTWDRANNLPIAMRVVRAMPDTSVELSPWYSWPEPPTTPVHQEWPTPADAPWP